MVLMILAFVLLAGIAYFQVTQGLFSSLIMAILSILCAAIAFNYYDALAQWMMDYTQHLRNPMFIYPAALVAIFFISLLALRMLFDRLINSNVVFGMWSDRIGGGAMGIITGMVLVGVLTVALQMLPWDASVMGYKPYDDSLQRKSSLAPFYADQFVVGLVNKLSGGSLAQRTDDKPKRFSDVHGDFLLELQAERNRCELPGRNDTKPGDLEINGFYAYPPGQEPAWLRDVPPYPSGDEVEKYITYVVRVFVKGEVRDTDGWYRLPATHFRMVTADNKSYYPSAFLTYAEKAGEGDKSKWRAMFDTQTDKDGRKLSKIGWLVVERNANLAQGGLAVDWVYKIPATETPELLEFRKVATVKLQAPAGPFPENNPLLQKGAPRRNMAR